MQENSNQVSAEVSKFAKTPQRKAGKMGKITICRLLNDMPEDSYLH